MSVRNGKCEFFGDLYNAGAIVAKRVARYATENVELLLL
jgi:hypothetical protein